MDPLSLSPHSPSALQPILGTFPWGPCAPHHHWVSTATSPPNVLPLPICLMEAPLSPGPQVRASGLTLNPSPPQPISWPIPQPFLSFSWLHQGPGHILKGSFEYMNAQCHNTLLGVSSCLCLFNKSMLHTVCTLSQDPWLGHTQ